MALTKLQDRDGLIYVIADGCGHYKVGFSNCQGLEERLKDLQCGNAFRLRCVHSRTIPIHLSHDVELMAHDLLKPFRVRGEWFRARSEAVIKAVDDCVERAILIDRNLDGAIDDLHDAASEWYNMKRDEAIQSMKSDGQRSIRESISRRSGYTKITATI